MLSLSRVSQDVTIHTQERISTDFEIPVSMRQGNMCAGIRLFLRQDIVQALTCFGSQGFILRLDVFSAQIQGPVSARQPLDSVLPTSNDSETEW